jgi:hypothetical protein
MMTKDELIKIKQLLEALERKCKTDTLYDWTREGLVIIKREIKIEDSKISNQQSSDINQESTR